jgi:hypothetical protein
MTQIASTDFDFLLGRWSVHHHKLADVTDRHCTEWVDFDGGTTWDPINWIMTFTRRTG